MRIEKLHDWTEADQALGRLAELRRELTTCATWRGEAIAKAKAEYLKRAEPFETELDPLEAELKRFTLTHRDELEGRSRALTHGRLGFLLVWDLRVRSLKKAVAWLVEAKKWAYLRVKHELNKEALWEAPDDVLKACGMKKRSRDEFWYEVDGQRVAVEE
jgi:phage host-nuclease inhibitor protein Gam